MSPLRRTVGGASGKHPAPKSHQTWAGLKDWGSRPHCRTGLGVSVLARTLVNSGNVGQASVAPRGLIPPMARPAPLCVD